MTAPVGDAWTAHGDLAALNSDGLHPTIEVRALQQADRVALARNPARLTEIVGPHGIR